MTEQVAAYCHDGVRGHLLTDFACKERYSRPAWLRRILRGNESCASWWIRSTAWNRGSILVSVR